MNAFTALIADFAEKTGIPLGKSGRDSIDVVADDVVVSALHRADHNDCVIFTLLLEDAVPDGPMLRRALELAANGDGTDGHFLGLKEGMLVLSAVLPLEGLDADEFGRRMLVLAAASHRVADALSHAYADGAGPAAARQDHAGKDFMRV